MARTGLADVPSALNDASETDADPVGESSAMRSWQSQQRLTRASPAQQQPARL